MPRQVKLQVEDNSCAKLQSKCRWQGRPEMKPVKLRSVILDMDGTITRFNLDSKGVKLTILAELEKLNLRSPDMTERSTILTLLKQMKDRLDTEAYEKLRNQFYRLLEEMEVKAAQETAFHPGVLDTLHKLRQRGLLLGLVTNNSRKGTDISL
ncbi:MAG TPA: HAD hydrolase-like protein, partial [Candidatus Bathyarchaeia archaeon]|nr:HAD hydrolase-like protein [Candidatus Bathyarchaeia archaeon]